MAAVAFDTHEAIKALTTGKGAVSKDTAEKMVTAIRIAQEASRGELATKADIAGLRGELDTMRAELRGEMQSLFWKLAAVFIIANAVMRYLPGGHP